MAQTAQIARDYCCGKSTAIRAHASKQPERPPTTIRLASECVDLNSKSENRVVNAQWSFLRDMELCSLIQHIHTHTNTNHLTCLSAFECCVKTTPLNHV